MRVRRIVATSSTPPALGFPRWAWWTVFLACQPYAQDHFNTGRQTFLLPMTWVGHQPRILPAGSIVPLAVRRPNLPPQPAPADALSGNMNWTDTFDGPKLALRWEQLRVSARPWYALHDKSLWIEPRWTAAGNQAGRARLSPAVA